MTIENKYPTVEVAKKMLAEAEKLNPGNWIQHSENVALAAYNIASAKNMNMDNDKAFVCGLLHDIGRRCGVTQMRHIIDGYNYCIGEGFDFVAKICLTHSFPTKNINEAFGKFDWSQEEHNFINEYILNVQYDDYDMLIQLCDCLGTHTGFCLAEKRMVDVVLKHGVNKCMDTKWKRIFEIKTYFESIIGHSIYKLMPGIEKNTFEY